MINKSLLIENTAENKSDFKPQEIMLYITETPETVEGNTFFRVQSDRKETRPNDLPYLSPTTIVQTDFLAISPDLLKSLVVPNRFPLELSLEGINTVLKTYGHQIRE